MTFAVSALVSNPTGAMQHVLWVLAARNQDEAEAQAMKTALEVGPLVSMLVKRAS